MGLCATGSWWVWLWDEVSSLAGYPWSFQLPLVYQPQCSWLRVVLSGVQVQWAGFWGQTPYLPPLMP